MNRLKMLSVMAGLLISADSYASVDSSETIPKPMTTITVNTTADSEKSSEYQLYLSNPDQYYASHPAHQEGSTGHYKQFPKDVLYSFAKYCRPEDAFSLLSVNKFSRERRANILIKLLPLMYSKLGFNVEDVFIQYDHPKWTPAALPDEVQIKLHYGWFFKAASLAQNSDAEGSAISNAKALRQFKLFYQAGCLGHMLAAERAGQMLLTPSLNTVIPAVITFDDLDPDAQKFDIQRLNESFLSQQFKDIWVPMCDQTFNGSNIITHQSNILRLLHSGALKNQKQMDALCVLAQLIPKLNGPHGGPDDNDYEEEMQALYKHILDYIEGLDLKSDIHLEYIHTALHLEYLDDFMDTVERKEKFSQGLQSRLLDLCSRYLSYETIGLRSLALAWDYMLENNGAHSLSLQTPEARAALEEDRKCALIEHMLGNPDVMPPSPSNLHKFLPNDITAAMSQEELQAFATKARSDRLIQAFLGHLKLTRNPSVCWILEKEADYSEPEGEYIFKHDEPTNPERLEMLKKHYRVLD